MFGFIREHQMNIMLALCAICALMGVMLGFTRFLPKKRKWILIGMEVMATLLLGFDRAAYTYSGDVSRLGFVMVRLSNFMVFFLTSAIVLNFNLYLMDLIASSGEKSDSIKRLTFVNVGAVLGMLLVIFSQFTGLLYSFDAQNHYQRGPGFLLNYIIPVICPIIQFTVICKYKKCFSRLIYVSLVLYIFVPIIVGIVQIFTYGISIVNMAMVLVSVSLYIFTYLDINDEVERAHELEVRNLQSEHESMKRLFDQTATAFVTASEKRNDYLAGHSKRVADVAYKIAKAAGKNDEECDEVYYSALLHNIGVIDLPDSLMNKLETISEEEFEKIKEKPLFSSEIVSGISEYPFLAQSVKYCYEKYDGSGYPEGLKGRLIPEISRIISVADAYDMMTSRTEKRSAMPPAIVREVFVKEAGQQYDPAFSDIMVQLIDSGTLNKVDAEEAKLESELECNEYRDAVSVGIRVEQNVSKVSFDCRKDKGENVEFSAPSIILFDSYDKRMHSDANSIETFGYLEYGELWFDGHHVSTAARNMKVTVNEVKHDTGVGRLLHDKNLEHYEIVASRYEDHMSLKLIGPEKETDIIVALPDRSKASYIGLTGEHCTLLNIKNVQTEEKIGEGDIERICDAVSYIDRLESDSPNIQIDRTRSLSTEAVEVKNGLRIEFYSMSLPTSNLVWHCPYIVLFYSDDKKVGGEGYKEYALIKLNGEVSGEEEYAHNSFSMKRGEEFAGWSEWKELNKKGIECRVDFTKHGDKVTVITKNLGISIENTTTIIDGNHKVYVALTGDQVALTDIRIRE